MSLTETDGLAAGFREAFALAAALRGVLSDLELELHNAGYHQESALASDAKGVVENEIEFGCLTHLWTEHFPDPDKQPPGRGPFPTYAQWQQIRHRVNNAGNQLIQTKVFDLPEDYVMLVGADGFTCGISPEGRVSS